MSQADLELLQGSAVPYVVIDVALGRGPDEPKPIPSAVNFPPANGANPPRRSVVATLQRDLDGPWGKTRSAIDRRHAISLVDRSKDTIKRVFEAARLGQAVRCEAVQPIVDDVTRSIERNAHTLLGVIRLKTKDEYTFYHSVAVCTLMINLARRLDLGDDTVRDFGLAGLLHDIGKMGIPDEVLNKPENLTNEEFALMRNHPVFGHQLLLGAPDMIAAALDVCLHHHEKMDGTGYPFAKSGDQISLVARAGAICDVYDAITSQRVYKQAWTPAEAVKAMWSWDGHFDRDLLFRFFLSIGVLPERLLVKLRSNRLGITMPHGRRLSRLRVCAFYNTRDHEWLRPELVTIRDDLSGDQILCCEEPRFWGFNDWDKIAESLINGQA